VVKLPEEVKVEGPIEGKPKAYLTPEQLVPARKVKDLYIPSLGGWVLIQSLTFGEMGDAYAYAKDDPIKLAHAIIARGLTIPRLEFGRIRDMPAKEALELAAEITKLGGWTLEAAEEAKKSLTPPGAGLFGT
jgi:hypothetical protein